MTVSALGFDAQLILPFAHIPAAHAADLLQLSMHVQHLGAPRSLVQIVHILCDERHAPWHAALKFRNCLMGGVWGHVLLKRELFF